MKILRLMSVIALFAGSQLVAADFKKVPRSRQIVNAVENATPSVDTIKAKSALMTIENSVRNSTPYAATVTYKFLGNCAPLVSDVNPDNTQTLTIEIPDGCSIQDPVFTVRFNGKDNDVPVKKMDKQVAGTWSGYPLYVIQEKGEGFVVVEIGYFEKGNPDKTTR